MLGIISSQSASELLYQLTIFLLFVIIMTFILRFLWNSTLTKHISVLRRVDTLQETFLLAVGIALFRL
jgi:uncharacterized membrane protein SirB2